MSENSELKRTLGLFETTAYGVGIIVGAGIYALIGAVAGLAGNAVWLSFIISSFLAVFTGLSYVELSSIFPKDAAEYHYVKHATGSRYLSFLVTWFVLAMLIITASTVAIGFGNYFSAFLFGQKWSSGFYILSFPVILALLAIVLMSYINYRGIEVSSKVNIPATLLEVGGLLFIVAGVFFLTLKGDIEIPNYIEMSSGFGGVMHGAIIAFFAFTGFGSLAKMSEEVKKPERTIPLAIMISILITTVIYALVAVASVAAVPWQELGEDPEPIATIANRINPSFKVALSVIALFSTGNTILISLISASRMIYGVSNEGILPDIFKKIHPRNRIPHYSVFFSSLLACSFALFKDIETIAEVSNLWIFIVYASVNFSALLIRAKNRKYGGFRIPLYVGRFPIHSILGFFFSVGMVVYLISIFTLEHPGLWLTLMLITSASVYYYFNRENIR